MNIETLRDHCLRKKAVEESLPFGPDTLVFKVAGKIFLLASLDAVPLQFNVKCRPEEAEALREQWACVIPGYHMNKRHWNTVQVTGEAPDKLLRQWIDASYDLVAKSLPKKIRDELFT